VTGVNVAETVNVPAEPKVTKDEPRERDGNQ
jgi:hypothetical protein